jgi:hypothetical protein
MMVDCDYPELFDLTMIGVAIYRELSHGECRYPLCFVDCKFSQ